MLRTTTHPVAHTHRGKSTITGLGWRAQDASPPTVPPPNTLSGENQAAKTSLSKPMGGRFEKSRLNRMKDIQTRVEALLNDPQSALVLTGQGNTAKSVMARIGLVEGVMSGQS